MRDNVTMLQWVNQKIRECEEEVKYLEEVLTSTSGPADQIVQDLEVNRRRLAEYRQEHSRYLKIQMDSLKNA